MFIEFILTCCNKIDGFVSLVSYLRAASTESAIMCQGFILDLQEKVLMYVVYREKIACVYETINQFLK